MGVSKVDVVGCGFGSEGVLVLKVSDYVILKSTLVNVN